MTTQITQAKLKELSIIKLYEHYRALEQSLPLLTPESQELAQAELETCANLRSEKVDRIYYAMAAHEDALERIKKEGDLITQAKRHHEAQLKSLKGLLNYLRRVLPVDANKITGRNYQFTLVKKKELTVEISTDPELGFVVTLGLRDEITFFLDAFQGIFMRRHCVIDTINFF